MKYLKNIQKYVISFEKKMIYKVEANDKICYYLHNYFDIHVCPYGVGPSAASCEAELRILNFKTTWS